MHENEIVRGSEGAKVSCGRGSRMLRFARQNWTWWLKFPQKDQRLLKNSQRMNAKKSVQSWENFFVRGLVKFVPAVAYHFCLSLPTTLSQPRTNKFTQLCTICSCSSPKVFKIILSTSTWFYWILREKNLFDKIPLRTFYLVFPGLTLRYAEFWERYWPQNRLHPVQTIQWCGLDQKPRKSTDGPSICHVGSETWMGSNCSFVILIALVVGHSQHTWDRQIKWQILSVSTSIDLLLEIAPGPSWPFLQREP